MNNEKGARLIALPLFPVFGGADQDRTDDLLNAIQALSQLSYSPEPCDAQTLKKAFGRSHRVPFDSLMVELIRIELTTS
jgi:hypothetical protein